jgi:hypothetical protein
MVDFGLVLIELGGLAGAQLSGSLAVGDALLLVGLTVLVDLAAGGRGRSGRRCVSSCS